MFVDSSEFNRIVEKYTDVVFRSALSFCKSKSDAEDVTQNAFIKLLKSEVDFESDDHIRKWLIRIVVNDVFGNFLYCCIFVCRFNRECKCKCLKDEKCNNCCRDDVFVDFKMIIYRIY